MAATRSSGRESYCSLKTSHRGGGDVGGRATPSGMNGGNRSGARVGHQQRDAIGDLHDQRDAVFIRHHPVRFRRVRGRFRSGGDGRAAVDLTHPAELRGRHPDGRRHGGPVFGGFGRIATQAQHARGEEMRRDGGQRPALEDGAGGGVGIQENGRQVAAESDS